MIHTRKVLHIMKKSHLKLALALSAVIALPACETAKPANFVGGQFWQRTSASEALHIRGPKAQQILNRDISRCVTELRELERLGQVKNAIPTDIEGHVMNELEIEMANWDTPERDKHLFAEHTDYMDFEGCMSAKGWERIEHVPYKTAEKSRENYLKTHVKYKKYYDEDSSYGHQSPNTYEKKSTQTHGDYGNLNEYTRPAP
tara:strand:- start:1410 stop:2015 length:606 start_codon:yes stop_codon:yes gene_type:complete